MFQDVFSSNFPSGVGVFNFFARGVQPSRGHVPIRLLDSYRMFFHLSLSHPYSLSIATVLCASSNVRLSVFGKACGAVGLLCFVLFVVVFGQRINEYSIAGLSAFRRGWDGGYGWARFCVCVASYVCVWFHHRFGVCFDWVACQTLVQRGGSILMSRSSANGRRLRPLHHRPCSDWGTITMITGQMFMTFMRF